MRIPPHQLTTAAALVLVFAFASSSCWSTFATPPPSVHAEGADETLEALLAGNRRFADGTQEITVDLMRRAALVEGQHPVATVLSCSDSRVVPELLFDQGLGDLFVIRVAGNVVDVDEAGSIEYAVEHLDTPLVIVLGHEHCGAVTAAVDCARGGATEEVQLIDKLLPSLDDVDRDLPRDEQIHLGVEANVRRSVAQLRRIAAREAPGRAEVVGAVYELGTGRIRVIDHPD